MEPLSDEILSQIKADLSDMTANKMSFRDPWTRIAALDSIAQRLFAILKKSLRTTETRFLANGDRVEVEVFNEPAITSFRHCLHQIAVEMGEIAPARRLE